MTHQQRRRAKALAQFEAREARPITSADCLRSAHLSGPCCKCGEQAAVMHTPMRGYVGLFCAAHCPCCATSTAARSTGTPAASETHAAPAGVTTPLPETAGAAQASPGANTEAF